MANPQVRERLQAMMSAHFDKWVDMEIPALGGLTPLQAIRTAEGREKVAVLVSDAERHARKMDPPVDESVLARLRDRLGLPAERTFQINLQGRIPSSPGLCRPKADSRTGWTLHDPVR
jgi:hypothetical protein